MCLWHGRQWPILLVGVWARIERERMLLASAGCPGRERCRRLPVLQQCLCRALPAAGKAGRGIKTMGVVQQHLLQPQEQW